MSMEISNRYGLDYINKAQTEHTAKATERAEEAAKSKEKNKPEMITAPKDEYISSEKSEKKPSGLYHMVQDENGNPKIIFDTPKKAEETESEPPKGAKLKGVTDNDKVQVTIGDMDKVMWIYVNTLDKKSRKVMLLLDLCQYFGHKKLKVHADFFNSSSSFCWGVI